MARFPAETKSFFRKTRAEGKLFIKRDGKTKFKFRLFIPQRDLFYVKFEEIRRKSEYGQNMFLFVFGPVLVKEDESVHDI